MSISLQIEPAAQTQIADELTMKLCE